MDLGSAGLSCIGLSCMVVSGMTLGKMGSRRLGSNIMGSSSFFIFSSFKKKTNKEDKGRLVAATFKCRCAINA